MSGVGRRVAPGHRLSQEDVTKALGAERVPPEPPPELRFQRKLRIGATMRELWRSREIVWTLAERDLRARYKQAFLGAIWAVLTPVALMIVFTLFLQRVAKFDTGGVPYPLFSYVGLLPWAFFSSSVSGGGGSLVTNNSLLNKVYCPREVFPLYNIVVAGVDMALSGTVLLLLFTIFQYSPKVTSLWVPLIFLIQLAFTMGVTLAVSATLVYLRDLRQALPIMLQIALFATPVAYPITIVQARFQVLYSVVNPLAPAIDGYRRTVLYGLAPDWNLLIPAAISAIVVLAAGYSLFKRLETSFADVA